MPCRKGVWKLITLWVTCKGDLQLATCHSSSWTYFTRSFWYSFVHGRSVDNIQLVVEEICAVDLQFGHDILLSFGICSLLWHFWVSVIDVDLEGGVLISSTSYFRILPESGTAVGRLELKIPTLVWHWDFLVVSLTPSSLILPKWWERAAGNSRRRVWS